MATAPIFICHAFSEDDLARDLSLALETFRLGVWRDTRGVRGSERLAPEVRWAIEQARQVIVVLGLDTEECAWLRREIEVAQGVERRRGDNTYRVIPLLLPGTDHSVLATWFTPIPRTPPIQLTPEGVGAALPALLAALGEPPLGNTVIERSPPPLAELELRFEAADDAPPSTWRLTARLNRYPEAESAAPVSAQLDAPPAPPPDQVLHWYLQDYPRWPTDSVRQIARRTDALLANWGRRLYRATLDSPALRELTAAWRDQAQPRERRLIISGDATRPAIAAAIDLPWELLHDETGFLIQGKQPTQFQRRLGGGEMPMPMPMPVPPPLRILAISPRPDTEPTGHADHRRSALPLIEALADLGELVETQALTPPNLPALEKCLNDAWAAGRPFTALYLDSYQRDDHDSGEPLFGFEASYESHVPLCRDAHFVTAHALAALLSSYRIRLVALVCSTNSARSGATAHLASILLDAGIAAVVTFQPATPVETLRRFWTAFYEELLRGARVAQALFVSQHRLAGDSYRRQGLGGGGVHLQDWFTCKLYLGQHDPRLFLRPPLELWRRLTQPSQASAPSALLPAPPAAGFIGRSRDLQRLERLIEQQPTLFLRGQSNVGKTAIAVELARWLARCGRYRHIAYTSSDDAGDIGALLDNLGRQLLPEGAHWSAGRYPTLWQATDYLRQTLLNQPTLIVLDHLDQWPSDQAEAFDRFWKQLMEDWTPLRLLGLGRLGPPPFAHPWREMTLSPLDDPDAITLIGRILINTGEAPPATDSGNGFEQLKELVALAGGHPGALYRLAHAVSNRGVGAIRTLLRPLRKDLLLRHNDDPQWPSYLSFELALRRLPAGDRERVAALAFFRDGANRIALRHTLEIEASAIDALSERLIALGLAEDQGYGHLRFDPTLSQYLNSRMDPDQRGRWRDRWRAGMEHLLAFLYHQYFKDNVRTIRLLRLELPNLLNLLRDCYQHNTSAERTARLSGQLEQLLAHLNVPSALAEIVASRERASQSLLGWTRTRFETERLRIERLRDDGSLEDALHATRQLLRQCQEAGADAYPGAVYDLARAHLQLGKLLKLAGAAEPAVRELIAARQQFQALADDGNASAGRMAAVANAESGDCLAYLRRLHDAADAYEAAIAHATPNTSNPTLAANQMQLGLVRQRQGRFGEAADLYDAARRIFESLGETEGTTQAWRQLGLARKLNGEMELALQACQQALFLCEQQRNRSGTAEVLGEIGSLHQNLNQLEETAMAYRRMAEIYAQLSDGRSEAASRNKLANVLILLRRHDEARQELYRASECCLPESPTARSWAIRRGLHDVGQAVPNPTVADRARQQAIQKYLAYRRAGGENTNPGAKLCTQIGIALQAGGDNALTEQLSSQLERMANSPNIPADGKLLIIKLQAILAGSRDPALVIDPDLHYQYAVELQLLLEQLKT